MDRLKRGKKSKLEMDAAFDRVLGKVVDAQLVARREREAFRRFLRRRIRDYEADEVKMGGDWRPRAAEELRTVLEWVLDREKRYSHAPGGLKGRTGK